MIGERDPFNLYALDDAGLVQECTEAFRQGSQFDCELKKIFDLSPIAMRDKLPEAEQLLVDWRKHHPYLKAAWKCTGDRGLATQVKVCDGDARLTLMSIWLAKRISHLKTAELVINALEKDDFFRLSLLSEANPQRPLLGVVPGVHALIEASSEPVGETPNLPETLVTGLAQALDLDLPPAPAPDKAPQKADRDHWEGLHDIVDTPEAIAEPSPGPSTVSPAIEDIDFGPEMAVLVRARDVLKAPNQPPTGTPPEEIKFRDTSGDTNGPVRLSRKSAAKPADAPPSRSLAQRFAAIGSQAFVFDSSVVSR